MWFTWRNFNVQFGHTATLLLYIIILENLEFTANVFLLDRPNLKSQNGFMAGLMYHVKTEKNKIWKK